MSAGLGGITLSPEHWGGLALTSGRRPVAGVCRLVIRVS